MSFIHFQNRQKAAETLAIKLMEYQGRPETLIFGLARGGVVIAAELGRALHLPFYPFIVRKIGCPGNPEYAIGAMAEGGTILLKKKIIQSLGISQTEIDRVIAEETAEMARRLKLYRKNKALHSLKGKHVILTDDGIATGSTMQVAVEDLRKSGATTITVAVPVSTHESEAILSAMTDRFITLGSPPDFYAVGQFYTDFPQVTDQQIMDLVRP